MNNEVNIPISLDWSKEEIIAVTDFFTTIEKAHDEGVKAQVLLDAYEQFKQVVPSKKEEKTCFAAYEKQAGVACWKTIQAARKIGADDWLRV